jgi:hypothetical protein
VLRWNEILMELVANSDLPPAPNPDGSYPAPDANNPFADPRFPFANPPYASRAYSYVSVAQFEALKAAWHFKYLYNRPAPSQVDQGIRALLPTNGVPAYPSEDAVLSGVTAELLKLLFPTEVEKITLKAGEQRQAALLAGKDRPPTSPPGSRLARPSRPSSPRAPAPTGCARLADRRRSGRPWPTPRPRAAKSRGAAWTFRRDRRCCRSLAMSERG